MSTHAFITPLRSLFVRTRPNAFSSKGVVSSSSLQSSLVGARILENGGNVADAAIATSAILCVTQNNLCGLGGDLFALIRMDGKPIIDLNGSGRASRNANIDYFRSKGLENLPARGENAAITVPGIVDAWHNINKNFGTMEFKELLAPAIKIANEGVPVTHHYHESVRATYPSLGAYAWGDNFTPGGKIPEVGSLFKQRDLAKTLSLIADEGPETYYRGNLSDRIIDGLDGTGVLLDSEDFKQHTSTMGAPLHTRYRGYDIYETSPNSQGATAILWLNLFQLVHEGGNTGSEEWLQKALETGLLAYSQRNLYITDPAEHPLPDGFCSVGYAEELLNAPDSNTIMSGYRTDPGDTTYFNLADGDGNSLSVIQSNYMGFGSGIMPKGTGFVLQNRGAYFSLDPQHHNALKPGKRTFHTLCAAMAEKDGEFQFSAGTMGGDIQPQIHFQMITSLVDAGMDPQLTLDKPRWAFPFTIYEKPGDLKAETKLYREISEFRKLPFKVQEVENMSSHFGHAQIVQRNRFGVVTGGSDPRGDGISIGVI